MILKIYKAINSSQRHYIGIQYDLSSKNPILKTKLRKKTRISGRNNQGRTTILNRGGGHKKRYRLLINYYKEKYNGIVYSIEYDPNRTALIASVYNPYSKSFFYTLAANNLKVGDILKSDTEAETKIGHLTTLKHVALGCPIYNISTSKMKCGSISKSAGNYSLILSKFEKKVKLLLSSGKQKMVSINSYCNIGSVSNKAFFLKELGKAGRSRWLGLKPHVKGICMNPVDHPNGGGEGKKSSKRKNPWGKLLRSKK
jgi:large subunit ribosomal protein L2